MDPIPYHPWDWYIYLHGWLNFMVNYASGRPTGARRLCYGACEIFVVARAVATKTFRTGGLRYFCVPESLDLVQCIG